MRRFQYLVTIDLDDEYFEDMVGEDPGILDDEFKGVAQEDFVDVFATKLAPALKEHLDEGLGDAGKSKLDVIFAGEVK